MIIVWVVGQSWRLVSWLTTFQCTKKVESRKCARQSFPCENRLCLSFIKNFFRTVWGFEALEQTCRKWYRVSMHSTCHCMQFCKLHWLTAALASLLGEQSQHSRSHALLRLRVFRDVRVVNLTLFKIDCASRVSKLVGRFRTCVICRCN